MPTSERLQALTTADLARLLDVAEDGQVSCLAEPAPPAAAAARPAFLPASLFLLATVLAGLGVLPATAWLAALGLCVWWLGQVDTYRPQWPEPAAFQVQSITADANGLSLLLDGEWHRFGWDALGRVQRLGRVWLLEVAGHRVYLDERRGAAIIRAARAVSRRPTRGLRRPTDGVPEAALSRVRLGADEADAERGLTRAEG